MLELSTVGKIFTSLCIALLIILCFAIVIGEEKKAQWFKKRTKYSWFLRRGILGEIFHFGYPCTKEGYGITILMVICIALSTFLVITFL